MKSSFASTGLSTLVAVTLAAVVVVCSAPALTPVTTTNGWEVVGGSSISAGPVMCCQVAASPNGGVFVAFQDDSIGNNPASVMTFSNGEWIYLGPQGGASIAQAWYNQLAFDATGAPFIASRDYGVGGKVNVRRFGMATGSWSDVGFPGPSASEAHYTDIAMNAAGVPYVVYADRSTSPADRATVLRFVNGHWSTVGTPGFSQGKADYPSIGVDPSGAPVVAFSDRSRNDASNTGRVSVMRHDAASNTWSYVGQPGFSPSGGLNVTLQFDKSGAPCVAYQQYHSTILVWRFDGSQWRQLGWSASGFDHPTVETEPWRQWISLAFDSQNAPYVAYQLLDNQNRVAVRRFDGQSWGVVGQPGFSPPNADYMSMTVDSLDVPWVVFRDSTQGGRATVMRYAPSPHAYCTASTDALGCSPRIATNGSGAATASGPYRLYANNVVSHRTGLLLYSSRPARMPFPGATMCVAPPYRVVGSQNSGGAPQATDCSGALSFDFARWIELGTDPTLTPGATVFAQFWYRDPYMPGRAGLTDALRFEIGL